ncbi:unnamed protein product [Caenorhabditis brenneri]
MHLVQHDDEWLVYDDPVEPEFQIYGVPISEFLIVMGVFTLGLAVVALVLKKRDNSKCDSHNTTTKKIKNWFCS